MDLITKRASLLSIEATRKSLGIEHINYKPEPKDSFFLCRLLFFFLGLMQLMPLLFLGTAANYWFYKFRNTTIEENSNAEDRTELQSLYQSCSLVAQSLPSVVFMSIMGLYGHKFNQKSLTVATLICLIAIFTAFTAFTQVDTDTWQTGFFITTMLLLVMNSAAVASYQLSSYAIIAKFLNSYMQPFLFGQGGIIIADILQVISISVTDHQPTAAVIYFTSGVLLIVTTLVLLLVAEFTEPYKVYVSQAKVSGQTGGQKMSWGESKVVLKEIWPSLVLLVTLILTLGCIHPAVDTLVVSEYDGEGTIWTKKYFVPVITFLMADAVGIVGRICSASFRITKSNQLIWVTGGFLRFIVSLVFVIFCNAQPRHLPVIFKHDWEYILYVIVFSFTNGFLFNSAILSLEELSGNKTEISLKLCSIIIGVASSIFSANGILVVKLL